MSRFLYVFEFQTPAQMASQAVQEKADGSCEAVFIEAESEEMALGWGREISEAFVNKLFPDETVSWAALDYPHRIVRDPEEDYPAPILQALPTVPVGVHPDFEAFKPRDRK